MVRALISVGSNINPAENTKRALRALKRKVRITAISTVYLSDAENRPEQPRYYNCIVEVETDMPAIELKNRVLLPIEDRLGRMRTNDKNAARTIDLDLILYGHSVIAAQLRLSAPDIACRPFIAIPLRELVHNLIIPSSEECAKDPARLQATLQPLKKYTQQIRKDILNGHKP